MSLIFDTQIYITFGLGVLLIFLVAILIYRRIHASKLNYDFKSALVKKGIIIDQESKSGIYNKLLKRNTPGDDDINKITTDLKILLEKEKLLKQRERVFTNQIKKLYYQTQALEEHDNKNTFNYAMRKSKEKKDSISMQSNDVKKVLTITDDLLEHLPEDVINEFVNSDDFKLYQKVVKEAKQ